MLFPDNNPSVFSPKAKKICGKLVSTLQSKRLQALETRAHLLPLFHFYGPLIPCELSSRYKVRLIVSKAYHGNLNPLVPLGRPQQKARAAAYGKYQANNGSEPTRAFSCAAQKQRLSSVTVRLEALSPWYGAIYTAISQSFLLG